MMGAISIALSFLILSLISSGAAASLPTVDLGYEVHQAVSFNVPPYYPGDNDEHPKLTPCRKPKVSTILAIFDMRHRRSETCASGHQSPQGRIARSCIEVYTAVSVPRRSQCG